ncbi:hypothetical protein KKC83_03180 [Patescibacteria group bacterium]|nr:hypothetical protein [Candidatus Falkowbacteria bacterium]MBU3905667.1 hypothetical protein [Patescibacteria group bacterium]MBU4014757.1 hypothetical protein [Patescibacteria group bacterium]MBU4026517.1 hypothetical protein [Patescibacteria group bacterium]MBU4073031.1 hypothetical protein [Patescibacteria group bacterium]
MIRFRILRIFKRLFQRQGLLAGNRNNTGSFNNLTSNGNFWSSSVSGSNAWNRNLNSTESRVNRNANNQTNGFSVRCLKHWFYRRGIKFYAPADTIYEFQETFK